MKKQQQPVKDNLAINGMKILPITVFDQQDGKLVNGMILEKTETWFALQCTDGQIRKFDLQILRLQKISNEFSKRSQKKNITRNFFFKALFEIKHLVEIFVSKSIG